MSSISKDKTFNPSNAGYIYVNGFEDLSFEKPI